MALASLIAGIVIVAALVTCCFVFIKKRWVAIILANLVFFLASALLGVIVFQDINEMKEKFPTEKKLFLMAHENKLIGGFSAVSLDDNIEFLGEEKLTGFQAEIDADGYGRLAKDSYMVVVIDSNALKGAGTIENGDMAMKEEEAFSVFGSEHPIDKFIEMRMKGEKGSFDSRLPEDLKQEILAEVKSEQQFKAEIFAMMLGVSMQKNGPVYLLEQYKKGNIRMYPETTIFSLIRLIPMPVFNTVLDKVIVDKSLPLDKN